MDIKINKRTLDLLEKVFAAEINAAAGSGIGLYQTKIKLAQELESAGYLIKDTIKLGGRFPVIVEGYRLTTRGNAAYCLSDRCTD